MGFCISAALSVLVLAIRGWWTSSGSLCTERMILARDRRERDVYTFESSFAKVVRQVESFYGERGK